MPKAQKTARRKVAKTSKLRLKKKVVLGGRRELVTDLKKKQFFKQLIDTTPFHLAAIDANGYYISWNKASEEMFGYTRHEVLGKLKPSIFHRNKKEAQQVINKALKNGEFHDEVILVKRNGEHFPALLDVKVLRDNSGNISGFLGSALDLTREKKMKEEIDLTKEKYQLLAKNSTDVIWTADLNMKWTFMSPSVELLTGYSVNEAMGMKLEDMVTPDSFKRVSDICKKRMVYKLDNLHKNTKPVVIDLEQINKDGSKRWVEITAKFICDGNGKPVNILGVTRDIHERKIAEAALRKSENTYRTIFENTGTATIIVEEDMSVSFVNSEFENISGYSVGEIVDAKSWTDFFVEEDVKKMKEYHDMRRKNPASAPRNYEAHFITRTGEVRNVFLTVAMIPGTKQSLASIMDITPLKAVENQLRASKKLFDDLVQGSPDAIFVINTNHKIVYWNNALEKMTGFKASNMIGTSDHWKPFYNKPTQQITDMIIDGVKWNDILKIERYKDMEIESKDVKGGIVCSKYFEHYCGGKKKVWLRFKIKPLYDFQNKLVGAIEIVEDITDQKVMRKLLENRMREFQVLYQVNAHIRMLDPLKLVLKKITEDIVLACDEVKPARARIIFDGKIFKSLKKEEGFMRKIEEPIMILGKKRGSIELGYIEKIENRESFNMRPEKKLLHIVANTLAKHIQHREILRRYQNLVTKSVVGIFIMQDGVFKYVNPKFSRIFKVKEKDVIGKSYKDFIPECICHKKFSSKSKVNSVHCTTKGMRTDGSEIEVDIYSQIISYSGRNAILGTIQDVTKLVEAQSRQRNFNQELKLKIADKTRDLQRINRRLQSLNELKDEFIAVTSHELRSPLTAARGYLSFLIDEGLLNQIPEEAKDYLVRVYDNVEVLNNLVNNILDVSRIEMDRLELHCQPAEIVNLIKQVISNLSFQANEKNLRINFINKLNNDSLTLEVDHVRIRQVIRNIIDNAIKYSPLGKEIDVEIEMRGIGVQISIADRGMGIRKSDTFEIFDKFKQAKNSNTHYNKGGAGLGLFIAKKIVELHNGMIWVESARRRGAIFRIQLPLN